MLRMAVELSLDNEIQKTLYEDQAIIYLKHFCRIRNALNDVYTGAQQLSANQTCFSSCSKLLLVLLILMSDKCKNNARLSY